jgi:hypothetical protein
MVKGTSRMRASVGVLDAGVDSLVVVVDGDRQHFLGVLLADHVIVQHLVDFRRAGHTLARLQEGGLVLLADDLHAQFDAFVADEDRRPGDQLPDLVLALAAERTIERVLGLAAARLTHRHSRAPSTRPRRPALGIIFNALHSPRQPKSACRRLLSIR